MEPGSTAQGQMLAKLIFNPLAGGSAGGAPMDLVEVIRQMQASQFVPEVFLIEPDCDLPWAIDDALARGIKQFVVYGGDGTISSVATSLLDKPVVLGIIPGGTRNNIALSLGIPAEVREAVSLLRMGVPIMVDVGMLSLGAISTPFLEVCTVGLASALFPSADDIQHGNLARVGDFLATLVNSPASEIRLVLDGEREITSPGHVVVVSNMPFVGPRYEVGAGASCSDGLLDVLFFAEHSKLDLLGHVIQTVMPGETAEDPRIQRYRVRSLEIETDPAMPVMVDGNTVGDGKVRADAQQGALTVLSPR